MGKISQVNLFGGDDPFEEGEAQVDKETELEEVKRENLYLLECIKHIRNRAHVSTIEDVEGYLNDVIRGNYMKGFFKGGKKK